MDWLWDLLVTPAGIAFSLVAVSFSAIVLLPWETDVLPGFERTTERPENTGDLETPEYSRKLLYIDSHGDTLEAWLYLPPASHAKQHASSMEGGAPKLPVVIMAQGLGGQKDTPTIQRFAAAYVKGGYAALVFDYRNFGGSSGEPRNWVSPQRHLQDWHAAVDFVLDGNLPEPADKDRVVLWGTSFAGGHVLVTAAEFAKQKGIKAVVSQVPHLSGKEASKRSLAKRGGYGAFRVAAAAIHDKLRALAGMPPAYIKLAGLHGELAFMQMDKAELDAYFAKHPKIRLGGWENKAPARLALETSGYNPINYISKVKVPVLFISAANDTLCPPELVREAAAKMGKQAEHVEYPVNHFQLYMGETWQSSVEKTLQFMNQHAGNQA